jgi:hypothetical protein
MEIEPVEDTDHPAVKRRIAHATNRADSKFIGAVSRGVCARPRPAA